MKAINCDIIHIAFKENKPEKLIIKNTKQTSLKYVQKYMNQTAQNQ